MKPSSIFALPALVAALALAGLPGPALASTTQHGTSCVPSGASNVGGVFYGSTGIVSGNATVTVICPIVRTVTGTNFALGINFVAVPLPIAGAGLYCTLESRDYNSNLLGSTTYYYVGLGPRAFASALLVLPQSQVPGLSSQTLTCLLPPNSALYDYANW